MASYNLVNYPYGPVHGEAGGQYHSQVEAAQTPIFPYSHVPVHGEAIHQYYNHVEAAYNPIFPAPPSEEVYRFSAYQVKAMQEVLDNSPDSESHIFFWSSRILNPSTYFQIESARRAESALQKEIARREMEYLHQREEQLIAEILENNRLMMFKHMEQPLSDEELCGMPYIAEEDMQEKRSLATNEWNSEESDRVYDMTMDSPFQVFLDAEYWSENADSYWVDGGIGGLVTYLPEEWL